MFYSVSNKKVQNKNNIIIKFNIWKCLMDM